MSGSRRSFSGIAIAATLLLLSLCTVFVASTPNEVSYQIHSQDDLRQWPQTLLKGATWFKFDLNYNSPAFCLSPSNSTLRVNATQAAELGCFLLNHDPPTLLGRSAPYNTSDDILAFVTSPAQAGWFRNKARPVRIALCSKFNGDVCDGSVHSQSYIALFSDFFNKAQAALASLNLAVEFLLDGGLGPTGARPCLRPLWQPWNSTVIYGEDGPDSLYSSDANASLAEGRFQVNNMESGFFSFLPAFLDHYGKFSNPLRDQTPWNQPYPYLIWEPSDQLTLLLDTGLYLSGPRHDAKNEGLRFAINIDPVQSNVYLGSLNGAAWNLPVSRLATDASPSVCVWMMPPTTVPGAPAEPNLMAVIWRDAAANRFAIRRYEFRAALSASWALDAEGGATLTLPGSFAAAHKSGSIASVVAIAPLTSLWIGGALQTSMLLLGDDSGAYALMDASNLKMSMQGSAPQVGSFSRLGVAVVQTGTFASVSVAPSDSLLLLVQATTAEGCALLVTAFVASASNSSTSPFPANTETCLLPGVQEDPTDVDVSVVALASLASPIRCASGLAGESDYVFALAYSMGARAYMAYGCLSLNEFPFYGATPTLVLSPVAQVGVGAHPSLSLVLDPLSALPYVLLTLDNGYCFNNELTNKRPAPALCDSAPNNQSGVLTYSYGSFESFVDLVMSSESAAPQSLSPCSARILHGMYDSGSAPAAAMVAGPNTQGDDPSRWALQIVEAHVGFNPPAKVAAKEAATPKPHASAADRSRSVPASARLLETLGVTASAPVPASQCGLAVSHAGIVVDAWTPPMLK